MGSSGTGYRVSEHTFAVKSLLKCVVNWFDEDPDAHVHQPRRHVSTPDGLPVQLAFDGWDAGALGFSTTASPLRRSADGTDDVRACGSARHLAVGSPAVFVLGSRRPGGHPDASWSTTDPTRLLEQVRAPCTRAGRPPRRRAEAPSQRSIARGARRWSTDGLPILTGRVAAHTRAQHRHRTRLADVRQWPAGVVEADLRRNAQVRTGTRNS